MRTRSLLAVTTLLALLAGGCAQHKEPRSGGKADKHGPYPVTVTAAGKRVTIEHKPRRIVSLGPSSTENLFAIGAGKQVVAADSLSNYPKQAPKTDLSALHPNVEAIAGRKPDLVVATDDTGGLSGKLAKLHIPLLLAKAPKDLDGLYGQLRTLGKATGHRDKAADTARRMRTDIHKLAAGTPQPKRPLSYFYEVDSDHAATSKTFIGNVLAKFGLRNIADHADKAGSGYPKLSAEKVLDADPNLIFLTDGQSPKTVGQRPGWSSLRAVRGHHVIGLDADTSSRWTPRLVELVRSVREAVTAAAK